MFPVPKLTQILTHPDQAPIHVRREIEALALEIPEIQNVEEKIPTVAHVLVHVDPTPRQSFSEAPRGV